MHKPPIFNAARALDQAEFAHPDRPSLSYADVTISVSEAARLSRKLAQLLAQAGVTRGDRVMVASHNSPYHFIAYIACARLGAVFVPVSFRLTQVELQQLVDFCAPRAIICEPEIAARGSLASTGTVLQFVIDDDVQAGPLSSGLANGYLALAAAMSPYDGLIISDTENEGIPGLNQHGYPDGLAAIFFTSGSVSSPRAVKLTHSNLWWGSRNFRDGFEYRTDETVLAVAPLSHIGGFNGAALDVFSNGGHIVVARNFESAEVLRLIEEKQVNILFGVPTMYGAMMAHPDFATRDLASLRLPLVGGSQVPAPMLGRLAARGLRPINVWGMTETSASGCFLPFEHCPSHPGSIGRPFAYVEARIVDPGTLEEVPAASVGELLVRGPSVTSGFWHGRDHNDASFQDGWLRTGDLARVEDGGFLSIVGRMFDRITTGGESLLPDEVEDVLRQYPGVSDAVVCGVPDEFWGEMIVAGITVEEGTREPTLAEVQNFASQVLARYKLPRYLAVFPSLPLNAAGKVNRAAVRTAISDLMAQQPGVVHHTGSW
ncbi:AMP-binding protein [Actinomycetaceae bacterium L2_0104]